MRRVNQDAPMCASARCNEKVRKGKRGQWHSLCQQCEDASRIRCCVEHCANPRASKEDGLCQAHRLRIARTGELSPEVPLAKQDLIFADHCSITGCTRPGHLEHKLCADHLKRQEKYGAPLALVPVGMHRWPLPVTERVLRLFPDAELKVLFRAVALRIPGSIAPELTLTCRVLLCSARAHTGSLCETHYWRMRRHGRTFGHVPAGLGNAARYPRLQQVLEEDAEAAAVLWKLGVRMDAELGRRWPSQLNAASNADATPTGSLTTSEPGTDETSKAGAHAGRGDELR